jgi:hypothetical protein
VSGTVFAFLGAALGAKCAFQSQSADDLVAPNSLFKTCLRWDRLLMMSKRMPSEDRPVLRFMTLMGSFRYRTPGLARAKERAAPVPVPKAARLADRPVVRPESGRRTRKKDCRRNGGAVR